MKQQSNTIVVGITGGIGSGKTTVARYFETLGHKVIYLDDIAKKIMLENSQVRNELTAQFGSDVFSQSGELNSELISKIVFNPEDKDGHALMRLNKIVHPKTIDAMISLVEDYEKNNEKIVFIESAILFETELDEGFDYIITVFATQEIAIERTLNRTALTKSEIELRMKFQMKNEEKAGLSDFIIDNNSDLQKLYEAADFVLTVLKLSAA